MEAKDLILQAEDIHKATELISSKLGNPVIIENKNFELISYSSSFDKFDQTQQKTILTKKCPIFIIDRLKKEGIVHRLEHQSSPIRVQPMEELGFHQRVVIAAKYLGNTIGYIWVQESGHLLQSEELALLEEISPHLGNLINDIYAKANFKKDKKEEVLWRLLQHEYGSESQLRHDASLVKLTLPERFTVAVYSITSPQYKPMLHHLERLVQESAFSTTIYALKTEYQVILVLYGKADKPFSSLELARDLAGKVKEQTGEEFYNFLIGIGKEYTSLYQMRKSFLEASEVIETANFISPRPESMPREFAQLGIYRYLPALYEKNTSKDYYSDDLLSLIRNDVKKQTDLLRTLEVYLKNDGKGKQTANELFIHPNTLNYRIKKIQELTTIDFNNFNMKVYLYTELLLLNNVEAYYQRYKEALKGIE